MANETEIKPKKPIWKKWWLWLIIIFVIIVIASAGGDEQKGEETPETSLPIQQENTELPSTQTTWQKVKSWSGTGIKKTESFTITGNQWRVNWENQGGDFGGGVLQIYVYRTGGDFPEELLANTTEVGSDTSYIYKSGTFYLDINSANTSWEIEIEELK